MWPLSARKITGRTRFPSLVLCLAALGFLIALFAVPNQAAWAQQGNPTAQQSQIQTQQPNPEQNTFDPNDLIYDGITPLVSPKDDLKTRVGKLTKLLSHPDPKIRNDAALALLRIGLEAKSAVPGLIKTLKDENPNVRSSATRALGKIGPEAKDAVPALIKTLRDSDATIHYSAALALGNIGPEAKPAVPALIIALQDESGDVRFNVALAMGRIGPEAKASVPALNIALLDPDEKVQVAAKEALEKIQKTPPKGDAKVIKKPDKEPETPAETKSPLVSEPPIEPKPITETKDAWSGKILIASALGFLILLLALWRYFRERRAHESKGPADILVRDWAIDSLDDDRLGTGDLARSIGRFLRNENTKAPLTLAITGNWGSGKSSIMGMLKDYLDRAGYPTIWFNAPRHHNEETHLFGALLECLHQGLPSPWTPSGMLFRFRLAKIRMKKQPVILTLIGGLAIFTVGFLWEDVVLIWNFSRDWAMGGNPSWPNKEKWYFGEDATVGSIRNFLLGPIEYIAALLVALTKVMGAFTSFGFNPKAQFRKVSKPFKTINIESDPGLEFKLDEDIRDIVTALEKKLTIFIADMDSCPPQQVLKVLKSVNFLSSSPRPCFIVMDMWLNEMVSRISPEFGDFIEEQNPQDINEPDENYKRRLHDLRVVHAVTYLDKMIQIEIAVPKIKPEVLVNLVIEEWQQKKSLPERWEEYRKPDEILKMEFYDRPIRFFHQTVFPIIIVFLVFIGSFLLASYFKMVIADSRQVLTQEKIEEIDTKIETAKRESRVTPEARIILEDLQRSRTELIVAERQLKQELERVTANIKLAFWGIGSSVGLLGLVFYLVITRKRKLQDSKNYRTALKIWAPVLALKEPNPRHLKRLVNLLRLISMRGKDKEVYMQPRNAEGGPSFNNEIPESEKRAIKFVMLMALEDIEVNPMEFVIRSKEAEFQKEIQEGKLDLLLGNIKIGNRDNEGWLERHLEARDEISKALINFNAEFPGVWPTEDDVERYHEFLGGVVLKEV